MTCERSMLVSEVLKNERCKPVPTYVNDESAEPRPRQHTHSFSLPRSVSNVTSLSVGIDTNKNIYVKCQRGVVRHV